MFQTGARGKRRGHHVMPRLLTRKHRPPAFEQVEMMSAPRKNNRNKTTELPRLKRKWTEKHSNWKQDSGRRPWSMSLVQLIASSHVHCLLVSTICSWSVVRCVVMTWPGVLYGRCVWGAGWGRGRGWAGCPAAGGGHWAPRQASCPLLVHPCHQETHPLHQGGTWRKDREYRVTMRTLV